MIHLERIHLPDGLRALAYRDREGNLVVYVSERLDAKGQRAAIMEAIRASRRAGWGKKGMLPVGIGMFLAIRALLGRVRSTVGARPVAWGTATATVVGASAAGVFIAAAPHLHGPRAAGRPPGPNSVQPSGQQPGGRAPHGRQGHPVAIARISPGPGQPASPAPGQPAASGRPRPAPTAPTTAAPGPAPSPAPAPSPTATQPAPAPSPTPSPSPSPSPGGGEPGVCVVILGIKVCLPPISVSLKV